MPFQLNMQKSEATLRLDLRKHGINEQLSVDVAFLLDVSESYEDEHQGGATEALMARLVPWGMTLDPDRQMDVLTFSDGTQGVHYVGKVNEHNYNGFVRKRIIDKVPGWNGGTNYSYVLRRSLQQFGWLPQGQQHTDDGLLGGLKRFFGSGGNTPVQTGIATGRKSLVILNTDGDSNDEHETWKLLELMEQMHYGMYVQFIAYANGGGNFSFLKKAAKGFNNVGLHIVQNMQDFTHASDEQINQWMITDELVQWLKN